MALAPGVRLGPYEILSPLGAGGMGEVWRARDTRLGRDVAVKVLPDHLASDRKALARFESEARALAALSHPGILALFDVGREGPVAYAVTELLEGETLRSALRRGPLPWREAVEIATGVADALEAAHSRGLVHRDVKPENLFLCAGGNPKVLDFGLARRETASPDSVTESAPDCPTTSGALVGTVGYMAPEQLRGLPVDHRADIFAFGCVLHEMVAGRRAFEGRTSSEVIAAVLHDEPRKLGGAGSSVPPAFGEVVDRCLRKDPAQRFSSARDVAFALRAAASDAGPRPRPGPRGLRQNLRAGALLAAAIGLALGVFLLRRDGTLPRVLPRQVTSEPGCEREPAVSPDGESIAFVAESDGRASLWVVDASGGPPLRLTDGADPVDSPSWQPDGRAILYASGTESAAEVRKVSRLGGPPQVLLRDAREPALSPDGRHLAFIREGENGKTLVWIAPIDDLARAHPVSGGPSGVWGHRQPTWSPDGRTICYRDFHDLWLLPASGGPAFPITRDDPADFDPVFSPDGRKIYFASYRGGTRALWRIGVAGGEPEMVTLGTGPESHPAVSRDGRRLVYATFQESYALVVVERATGRRTRLEESSLLGIAGLDPLGRFLVFTSSRESAADLWVAPLQDGRPSGAPRRLTELGGRAACPAVAPDGRWIAFYLVKGRARDVYVVPSGGGQAIPVAPHSGADLLPAWSRDGKRLAFVSDREGTEQVHVVNMRDGRPDGRPERVTNVSAGVSSPRFLPDGRLVFVAGVPGEEGIWIVDQRTRALARVPSPGRGARLAIPDRGGKDLLVLAEWGNGRAAIRTVALEGRDSAQVAWGVPPDLATRIRHFDLSEDGRLAVLLEESRRGDVWVLQAQDGRRF